MSVSTISPPTVTTVQTGHHAHRFHGKEGSSTRASSSPTQSTTDAKASESIEQLAAEGDPTTIAELKAEHVHSSGAPREPDATATGEPRTGASEPGKGEAVDVYV